MRASKENAEKAYQALHKLGQDILPQELSKQDYFDIVEQFINAAKRELPSEAAFDANEKRRRIRQRDETAKVLEEQAERDRGAYTDIEKAQRAREGSGWCEGRR